MTDNVSVSFGDSAEETAVLLLAATEELEQNPGVVTVDQERSGHFVAPADVVKKAGLKPAKFEEEEVPDRLSGPTPDFFADNEGVDKPEQQVATDPQQGAPTTDPNQVAEKPTPQKAAAKKSTAKK